MAAQAPRKRRGRRKNARKNYRAKPHHNAAQGRAGAAGQARRGPTAATRRGVRATRRRAAATARGRDVRRIEEIEAAIEKLRREKQAIALRPVRERRFPKSGRIRRFRGALYATWFKAAGSMAGGRDWDSYDRMAALLDDVDFDTNAPTAFYSGHILGRVKFPDIVPLESLIDRLNTVGGWEGDFRDIYPQWNYEYRVIESIGGVPTRIWARRATNRRPQGK